MNREIGDDCGLPRTQSQNETLRKFNHENGIYFDLEQINHRERIKTTVSSLVPNKVLLFDIPALTINNHFYCFYIKLELRLYALLIVLSPLYVTCSFYVNVYAVSYTPKLLWSLRTFHL